MNAFSSRMDFAIQSIRSGRDEPWPRLKPARGLIVVHSVWIERGVVALIVAYSYPHAGTLLVEGLLPGRHYHVRGAACRFCRADGMGSVHLELVLNEPAELILRPVI